MSNFSKLYRRIQSMSDAALENFAAQHHVDMTQEFDDAKHARTHVCEQLNLSDDGEPGPLDGMAGVDIDRLAREIQRQHPDISYADALRLARENHPELAEAWENSFPGGVSAGKPRARRV